MKVLNIDPDSPLFGYVRPGYVLKALNGRQVQDAVDYQYRVTDEQVQLTFADTQGREVQFDFDSVSASELGLTLDDHKVKFCKNDCIFCFVAQQPQGMRRALYFRDEDYRLSFTHGNFVTLSNTTEADLRRIIEQRLSPLYVSVHATDDRLRRCMLRNEKLAPLLPRLRYLTENGITIHSQVVLCPGVNDGQALEQTITDLAGLFPGVESLAIVPVGLTKYRRELPSLRSYKPIEAVALIRVIEARQKQFLSKIGSRFIWPADEFYVLAGKTFPRRCEYESMPQFENGIGMAREFIAMFNRRRACLKDMKSDRRVLMVTGHSAHPFLSSEIFPFINERLDLPISLERVSNHFWGGTVTVSGPLTGQDILKTVQTRKSDFDLLVLPPNCLNDDELFLDNMTLSQFRQALGRPVLVGQYDLAATIKEAFS